MMVLPGPFFACCCHVRKTGAAFRRAVKPQNGSRHAADLVGWYPVEQAGVAGQGDPLHPRHLLLLPLQAATPLAVKSHLPQVV